MPGRIMAPAFPLRDPAMAATATATAPTGIPISDGLDPFLGALRASAVKAVAARRGDTQRHDECGTAWAHRPPCSSPVGRADPAGRR